MTMKMMLIALCALTAVFRLNAADPQEKDNTDSKEVASAEKGSSNDPSPDKTPDNTKTDTKDAK